MSETRLYASEEKRRKIIAQEREKKEKEFEPLTTPLKVFITYAFYCQEISLE